VAELPARARRPFPNRLTPVEARLPPPEPGQKKPLESPVATLVAKERNQSSPLLAALVAAGGDVKVSRLGQLTALNS
jgi:hypothetical protein